MRENVPMKTRGEHDTNRRGARPSSPARRRWTASAALILELERLREAFDTD